MEQWNNGMKEEWNDGMLEECAVDISFEKCWTIGNLIRFTET
jgi:hypothetical protein